MALGSGLVRSVRGAACLCWALTACTSSDPTPPSPAHSSPGPDSTGSASVDFDREIRPLLSQHCFSCHGPDAASRQANLRLDVASGLFEARGPKVPVVVKGDPEQSLLYLRVSSPDTPMPPRAANLPLSAAQIERIRAWIEQGAVYSERWFLNAPVRPVPPAVSRPDWVRNPIDAFILQKLDAAELEPRPVAEPRALVRRVTLELTGLPPAPADVDAFLADPSDAAYEALVDRLLASVAFGEQRAHHWLDAARYADTHGFHMDNYRTIWPYRDWVIAAFNAGMPFDQFTRDQLAGDLLPAATVDQQVATGFIRCTMSTGEGGTIEAEAEAAAAKERVETLGRVWLGLTTGCAACHDHKFDPISQREFYGLAAFFRHTTQEVLDHNLPNPPPVVAVPPTGTETLVTGELPGTPTAHVLVRGAYDHVGEEVTAGVPAALPALPEGAPLNRLGLAAWLTSPEHPLTARVTVNRFWAEVFGQGIVPTPHDLGSTGDVASHPELLDWLAVEFRESGWNVKALFKLLVTSASYRQSAAASAAALAADPANRLISRGPRFRMDAELIRDLALAASGLLVTEVGGPSVKPYQPAGYWESITPLESNTYTYYQDTGAALYRRSLYTFWKRQAPPPSLTALNAPSRELSVVRRERTNTPLQAFVTLNDPQFVEAARNLASLALAAAPETEARLAFIAARVLSRPLTQAEVSLLVQTLASLQSEYGALPDQAALLLGVGESPLPEGAPPSELAAWTLLANTFLNLDEALHQ
jgi:hypothetical protein